MSSRGGIRRGSTAVGTPGAATAEAAGCQPAPATPKAGRRQPLTAQRLETLARLAGVSRLELVIEKLVHGGDGLARWRGLPVLVPRAAPGDVVRARVTKRSPSFARAEIEEVLKAGPDRRPAPCPVYDRCGGCQLQHIRDEAQLGLKTASALETLRRIGGIDPAQLAACRIEAPVGERQWGYRLRARFQVERAEDGTVEVGFRRRRSRELVAVDRCPVLAPALERELAGLPTALDGTENLPSRLNLATAGLEPDSSVAASPPVDALPGGELEIELHGRRVRYDARCFFQAHGGLLAPLLRSAVGSCEGHEAVELHAGVGFFTVGLADRYSVVTAVEGDAVAVRHARNNLRRNRLRHCRVDRAAVESWVDGRAGAQGLPRGLDRVLVDPPRAGLSGKVRRAILRASPRRLTYVSCDPATLARDLGEICRGYQLESITFFDIFPQTAHIETVVQARRLPRPDAGGEEAAAARPAGGQPAGRSAR